VATTPLPGLNWLLVDVEGLSPGARRALLACLGVRRLEDKEKSIFSDVCLCEVADPMLSEAAYRFAEERCGTRIPLVIYSGPPARLYIHVKDLGALAAWYFQAIERLHRG
jgi:hypothetical protein